MKRAQDVRKQLLAIMDRYKLEQVGACVLACSMCISCSWVLGRRRWCVQAAAGHHGPLQAGAGAGVCVSMRQVY